MPRLTDCPRCRGYGYRVRVWREPDGRRGHEQAPCLKCRPDDAAAYAERREVERRGERAEAA